MVRKQICNSYILILSIITTVTECIYSNYDLRVKHFHFVAAEKLYGEFLESLQSHGTEQQVFDIVTDFIQTCSDTLDVLRDMERKVSQKVGPLSLVSVT
jgi:hypothetical protein